jgi:hypothetical protein
VPPLGFVEPVHCSSVPEALGPDDRLLLYTDGVLRHDEGLEAWLERAASLARLDGAELVRSLLAEGAEDDRTALLVGRRKPEARE